MANIQDNGTHFTFHSKVGRIADSFFYFTYWYNNNYVLVTLVQGKSPAAHADWLSYLDKSGISHELVGGSCLIMPESVEQLFLEENTFRGNSEIYVLNKKPDRANIPGNNFSPSEMKFGEELPDGFLESVRGLEAVVFMSDGDGVNMASKFKEEIIYFVKEMSLGA